MSNYTVRQQPETKQSSSDFLWTLMGEDDQDIFNNWQ